MERIHLDLKVPRGWQQCSTRELEMIAEEMIRSQMNASLSRFHPFDWTEIKTRLFFRLSGVEVIDAQTSGPDIDAASQSDAQTGSVTSFRCRKDNLEFDLQTWQVHSFIDQLKWLDATDANGGPRPMPKLMWPYPERLWRWQWRRWMPAKAYYRPGELLDGMTWQQYRWINDWMEVYTNTANALIAEREKHAKADHERIRELTVQQAGARMEVLAQLFCVGDNAAPSKAKPAPRRLLRKITDVVDDAVPQGAVPKVLQVRRQAVSPEAAGTAHRALHPLDGNLAEVPRRTHRGRDQRPDRPRHPPPPERHGRRSRGNGEAPQ